MAASTKWLSEQHDEELFTTSISQAEILAGIAVMPDGRRRFELETVARAIFDNDFHGRIPPFDTKAAIAYADILAAGKRAGRATAPLDLMIAAVAQATRRRRRHARHRGFRGMRRHAHQSVGDAVTENAPM